MVKLIPVSKTQALNFLIPAHVKQAAIQGFLDLTSELDVRSFRLMIEKNLSIWHQILAPEQRDFYIQGAKDSLISSLIPLADQNLVMNWVTEARTDLKVVLSTTAGRLWLLRQVNEIRAGVTAE